MHPSPTRPGAPTRTWPALVAYFRQCLEREQMERLQVALERRGYALLRMAEDRLITREASEALITDPQGPGGEPAPLLRLPAGPAAAEPDPHLLHPGVRGGALHDVVHC